MLNQNLPEAPIDKLTNQLKNWALLRDSAATTDDQKKKLDGLIQTGTTRLIKMQEELEQQAIDELRSAAESESITMKERLAFQKICKHTRFNKISKQSETLLGGQFLQVPRVLFLFCQEDQCLKEFSIPAVPENNWEEPPSELIPDMDDIGGVLALAPEIFQRQLTDTKK